MSGEQQSGLSQTTRDVEMEKKYFQKVLDDVVNINSFLTFAVFVGLSFAQPGHIRSLANDPSCDPDNGVPRRLVAFEIASFSFFIFAGFLAKTVKVFLYTSEMKDALEKKQQNHKEENGMAHRKFNSLLGFYLSIYGTMFGCLLLLLAMVDVVQIKLGRLSCHDTFTNTTVSIMVVIVGLSLLIYFVTVSHGVFIYAKRKNH